jgi:hypothetical protein
MSYTTSRDFFIFRDSPTYHFLPAMLQGCYIGAKWE